MCMMVYVASDDPLPPADWDINRPSFHVTKLFDLVEPVRRQFTKRHVYYVGSHESCGCGFQYGQYEGFEENPDDLAAAQVSRRRLADFLTDLLLNQSEIELYACWDGDQAANPEHRGRISPLDLIGERTFFREKELLVVENPAE